MGRLRVHAEDLAAEEGTHLHLLPVHGEGGQLAGAVVLAQLFGNGLGAPRAADPGADAVADGAHQEAVVAGREGRVVAEGAHSFGGGQPRGAVEVAHLPAVFVQPQRAAIAEEEARQIPAVGDVHLHLLAGGVGGGEDAVQRLHVLLGEYGLIVVEEIAVVGGHRVAVEYAVDRGGLDGNGRVGGDDRVQIARHLIERVGVDEVDDLVVRVGKHVRGSGGVFEIARLGVRFADHAVGERPLVFRVFRGEGFAQLGEQFLILLAAPDLQRDLLRQRRAPQQRQRQQRAQHFLHAPYLRFVFVM